MIDDAFLTAGGAGSIIDTYDMCLAKDCCRTTVTTVSNGFHVAHVVTQAALM